MRILTAVLAMLLLSYPLSQMIAQQRENQAKVSKVVDESPKKSAKDTKNTVKDKAKEATKEKDEKSSIENSNVDNLQKEKDKEKVSLRKLSDKELLKILNKNKPGTKHEALLVEIVRRGGKYWQGVLKKRYEALAKQHSVSDRRSRIGRWWRLSNLRLLTALRRVQKKPDPLMILIPGKLKLSCKLGYLPFVHLMLTNLDIDKTKIEIQDGGHDRSGRLARWRFHVQDKNGKVIPQRDFSGRIGGGISSTGELKYGESLTRHLDMSDYVSITQPGIYTVRIFFHNDIAIADRENLKDLIVCKSQPFTLTVEPIEVELTKADRKAARKAIQILPLKGHPKIQVGLYAKRNHDFINPKSPSGKILTLGWKAVPELIDAAVSEKTDPKRRAKILGLLFSITNQNDPRLDVYSFRNFGILGPFESRDSGWRSLEGPDGITSRMTWPGSQSSQGGKIDKDKQLKFSQRWKPWKKNGFIKVVEVEEDAEEE